MTARTTLPALIAEAPLTPQPPVLVLFGRDRGGKPRAAWFDCNQAEAARAAADAMKLRTLPVAGTEQCSLATQLAHGRILPSGKAHVPGARRDLYGRLVAFAGESAGLSITECPEDRREPIVGEAGETSVRDTQQPEAAILGASDPSTAAAARPVTAMVPADSSGKPKFGDHNFIGSPLPRERDEIGVGSLVLAHESPEDGWWEAEVIGMNGRVFSCRWRDYPQQGTFLRQPGELALMPPGKA